MPKLIDLLKEGKTLIRKINWNPDQFLEFPAHAVNEVPLHCALNTGGQVQNMSLGEVDDQEETWEEKVSTEERESQSISSNDVGEMPKEVLEDRGSPPPTTRRRGRH